MNYTDENRKVLLQKIGKNINYYHYHCNNIKIMNDKGFVTIEKLAEEIDSSPNMLYNLTAKKVEQGVSVIFLDKLARVLDVSLSCFFLNTPLQNPPRYKEQ